MHAHIWSACKYNTFRFERQARIKWYNRKGEFLFREVEHQMAMAYAKGLVSQALINA